EATTLSEVLKHLDGKVISYGFDLSWSRIAYAKHWLQSQGIIDTKLCTGDLLNIPFADQSIDIIYTSHSIEPNGGNERKILKELFRVARKFLILLEPGYELAGDDAKKRMESHGYCKNLHGTAESLGCEVLEHKLFPFASNPHNPTAMTIIKKNQNTNSPLPYIFACPLLKTRLEEIGSMLFSPEALAVYPIVGGIPCLRVENGIVASKYKDVMKGEGARHPSLFC
ncbi:MAG: methyltransferase domain-containing protein, partial [Candidatus Electrothrix sp. AUS1_2]|nr:methyltransferase domain-containing protein [Candidatus Electrothrix sp. AUS1_2]